MRTQMMLAVLAAALADGASAAPPPPPPRPAILHASPFAGACIKPAEPDLKFDPALKGRAAVRAHNEKIRVYNAHVAAVNVFLQCIADEATRELDAYYLIVTAAQEAEQNATLARLEALRVELTAPKRP